MKKKNCLWIIISLAVITACSSSRNWTREDFRKHASSRPGGGIFAFKYFGHEVNRRMGICCFKYLDSSYTVDALPIKKIARYMETRYSTQIDTSKFEALRKAGFLKSTHYLDKKKHEMLRYFHKHVSIDDYDSWSTYNWSEYRESVGTFTHERRREKGKSDQMQVYITTNIFGSTAHVFLRVREGKPDKKGYYNLVIVAQEKISLPFTARGCHLEEMKKCVSSLHTIMAKSP